MERKLEELQDEYTLLAKENVKDEESISNLKEELKEIKECMKYKNKKEYMIKRLIIPFSICGGVVIATTPLLPLTLAVSAGVLSYVTCSISYENKSSKYRDEHFGTYICTVDELEHMFVGKKREIKRLRNNLENRKSKLEVLYSEIDDIGIKSELDKFYQDELENNKVVDNETKDVRKDQIDQLYVLKEQYSKEKVKVKIK